MSWVFFLVLFVSCVIYPHFDYFLSIFVCFTSMIPLAWIVSTCVSPAPTFILSCLSLHPFWPLLFQPCFLPCVAALPVLCFWWKILLHFLELLPGFLPPGLMCLDPRSNMWNHDSYFYNVTLKLWFPLRVYLHLPCLVGLKQTQICFLPWFRPFR